MADVTVSDDRKLASIDPKAVLNEFGSTEPAFFPFLPALGQDGHCATGLPISRISRNSNGTPSAFEALPRELIYMILHLSDVQSLCRLSSASLRCKAAVDSLPAYCDLREHAGRSLLELSACDILGLHSSGTIHAALKSSECVSCRRLGPYLFLPTCERCCHTCLLDNPALWVTTLGSAIECFHLGPEDRAQLYFMRRAPGFGSGYPINLPTERRMVSVRSAKQLALARYGSHAAIGALSLAPNRGELPRRRDRLERQNRKRRYVCYRNGDVDPAAERRTGGPYMRTRYARQNILFGCAVAPLPILRADGQLELVVWCRACVRAFDTAHRRIQDGVWAANAGTIDMVNVFTDKDRQRLLDATTAWGRSSYLQHFTDCHIGDQE